MRNARKESKRAGLALQLERNLTMGDSSKCPSVLVKIRQVINRNYLVYLFINLIFNVDFVLVFNNRDYVLQPDDRGCSTSYHRTHLPTVHLHYSIHVI